MFTNYSELAPPSHAVRFSRTARSLLSGTISLFAKAWHLLALWRRRARARAELRMLCGIDPRTLRDIGLGPDDVQREMSRPFWK